MYKYRFDDGRYALLALHARRAYLLSSNLFGTCSNQSQQNALSISATYEKTQQNCTA